VANQIAGAVVNAQLFTVQKSLESRLMQAQKLEAIGTLAAGIAHDFNNILAAIVGYAELINWEVRRGSKAERNLQELLKASGRAKDLVQQILTFSRESRQERKPLEIKPVVKESLKLLRASLPSSIEIREEIENDIGKIEADPTQIHQVLMNLCTNAAHAMRKNGGLLKVSLSNVDMDASTAAQYPNILPGPFIRLSVSDTGHGMSPEVLARIFDPYFTTKEVDEGTGLGLAVVHGIVESYRGAITVYSEPGSGTTFHVYFPQIDHAKEVAVTQKVEPLLMGKNERILFIDDEQALVDVGEQILKSLRYEVTIGTSSIEALELFRKQPERFDLVITDMTMPNMTGDKLAKELLRIRPDIPIVLCTGYNERITGEAAKEMGIREFAMKPLVASDLAKTIRRALDQQKEKWPEYES
jgi:nitrogen-specific signal transduction histidine kinase/CheY-like chemotaxis protein